jgi:hypothetical protein
MRLFVSAAGTSTVPLSMTAVQTTAVLVSTSGFPVPLSFQQFSVVILDSGNPAWDANNPLVTPYEYCFVTGNNTGTNTLTFIRGQESTTGKAFFAGATIAATPLPTDFSASFMNKIGESLLVAPGLSFGTFTIPSGFRSLFITGCAQSLTSTADIGYRFNADSGNNYALLQNYNSGSGPAGGATLIKSWAQAMQVLTTTSGVWTSFISHHNNVLMTNKPVISSGASASIVIARSAYWNQSVSITSLEVLADANLVTGSFVEVFGIP